MASRPEERYVKLETKTLPDGRVVYKPALPITIPSVSTDTTIVVGESDRMDIIANNVYGSAVEWWRLAAANGHVDGSLHSKPGSTMVIPKI